MRWRLNLPTANPPSMRVKRSKPGATPPPVVVVQSVARPTGFNYYIGAFCHRFSGSAGRGAQKSTEEDDGGGDLNTTTDSSCLGFRCQQQQQQQQQPHPQPHDDARRPQAGVEVCVLGATDRSLSCRLRPQLSINDDDDFLSACPSPTANFVGIGNNFSSSSSSPSSPSNSTINSSDDRRRDDDTSCFATKAETSGVEDGDDRCTGTGTAVDDDSIVPLLSASSEQIGKQRWATTAEANAIEHDDERGTGPAVDDDSIVPPPSASSEQMEKQRWATSATTTAQVSPSPIHITEEEHPLVAELCHHLLRRGVLVDFCTAWGAASVCLVFLMMSQEPTPDALQATGADELVAVARANLHLSADVTACLLSTLVGRGATAALLAADPQPPNPCLASSGDQDRDNEAGSSCSGSSSSSSNTAAAARQPAQEGEEEEAKRELTASVAATALAEACRAWADTVEAAETTPGRSDASSSGADKARSTLRRSDGVSRADEENSTLRRRSGVNEADKENRVHPVPVTGADNDDTEHVYTASPMGVGRVPSGNGFLSAGASATPAVAGPRFCRRNRQRAASSQIRQAIRVVTSGALNSYGQLVVLGYKEFDVRESTWHRVGTKNDRFVLTRRKTANGVSITGDDDDDGDDDDGGGSANETTPFAESGSGDGMGSDDDDNNNNNNNATCSPAYRRVDESISSCKTPTRDDNEDRFGDNTATKGGGGGGGGAGVFVTPEARSNELRGLAGAAAPRRTRGAEPGGSARCGNGSSSGSGNCSESWTVEEGARHGGREAAAAEDLVAREREPYRIKLTLSAQQKEDAEAAAAAATAAAAAAADSAAEVQGGGAVGRGGGVVHVACFADRNRDMYQLGRMHSAENDFAVRGPLHQSVPSGKVCGPVSRYAMRLLVDREPPNRCRIFTGGFNERRCMTFPKASPKWMKEGGGWDAVTTFGVRILKPEIGEWREVTMVGGMRRPRLGRLDAVGELMPEESNELTTGTVIDVGGVQMLYESAESMARLGGVSPSEVIELLNGLKPQCPVQLQTLRFRPWRQPPPLCGADSAHTVASPASAVAPADTAASRGEDEEHNQKTEEEEMAKVKSLVPHVFTSCGHVQGYARQLAWGPCPMCRTPGPLVEIGFGWCSAIDRDVPSIVFNPCGHAASKEVAERWTGLAMPNNAPPDAVYRPICPYCAKPLLCKNGERPYNKMIFAQ